jgi:hypothetical protein
MHRAVVVTTDPQHLPDLTTWNLLTNLSAPGSERAATSRFAPASLPEIVRLYGLRMWVEQSYKPVKQALGWAEDQMHSDLAIRRHWMLVWCAFSFCWWHLSHGTADVPGWLAPKAPKQAGRGRWTGGKSRTHGQPAPVGVLAGSVAEGARVVRTVAHAGALLAGVVAAARAA